MLTATEIDTLLSNMDYLLIILRQKFSSGSGDIVELGRAYVAISEARSRLYRVYNGEDKSITVGEAFASADKVYGEKVKLLPTYPILPPRSGTTSPHSDGSSSSTRKYKP